MATNKTFDIILRSKYTPEGVRGALAGLKSIGEAGFFIRQGLIAPLQQAGAMLLDFIGAANPERIKQLSDAFAEVKVAIGSLLDDVLGPTISELTRLIRQATLLTNASKNLEPIYADFFETMKREGKDAADIVDEIGAASRCAVDQLAEGIRQNPLATIGVQAKDAAISTEQFRNIILASSRSRIRIEEDYQERLRQIRQSSDQTIEEAIRRRDARALAAALNARKEQIDNATRDRDKSQRDQSEDVERQRAEARKQAEESRRQAEDSARQAIEAMRRQNEETARDTRIAQDRQLRDFRLNLERRLEDQQIVGRKEVQI